MSDQRVAIIGYGLAGRVFHAPLVAATPGMTLAAIVTSDRERRAQAAAEHPDARLLASVELLWEHAGELDCIVVATPNDLHAPLAGAAVDRGLPVVVDKPLAPTAAEAQALVDRAGAAGVLLTVFQNRRWDSDQLLLARLIAEDSLGTVLRCESRLERWRPEATGEWRETTAPEQGGGQLLDLGSHLVDQALTHFGPAAEIYAEITARRATGSDDDAFVAITHHGGVISHLHASALVAAPGPRLRVLGTEAALLVGQVDSQEDRLQAGERPDTAADWGVEPAFARPRLIVGERSVPLAGPPGNWPRFYALLRDALAGDGSPPVDPHDAVAALRVLELARLSAAEHRVVAVL